MQNRCKTRGTHHRLFQHSTVSVVVIDTYLRVIILGNQIDVLQNSSVLISVYNVCNA